MLEVKMLIRSSNFQFKIPLKRNACPTAPCRRAGLTFPCPTERREGVEYIEPTQQTHTHASARQRFNASTIKTINPF